VSFSETTLIGGLLILMPVYLSVLLLKTLKGMLTVVAPVAAQNPGRNRVQTGYCSSYHRGCVLCRRSPDADQAHRPRRARPGAQPVSIPVKYTLLN